MSNEKKLIPEFRFPEFVKAGEWVGKKLGDLGHFLGGGTPDRSDNSYWIGDIPWISSSDINEDDIHNISTTRFINNNAIKQSATKIIPKGSVLFVSRVGVGKLAINKEELCTSQDFTSFVPKKDVLNFFIGYYFSSDKNLLQSLNQGTSIKGFSKSELENFKFPYPKNLKEQQKIASCLSSLDEVITSHSHKLELLKAHKKGLMQNLFPQEGEKVPKYRFPEFEKDGDWKLNSVGNILKQVSRPVKMSGNKAYSLVTVKRRYGGVVSRGIFKGNSILVKSQFSIKENDFLISKRQIVHCACGVVPEHLKDSIVSNEYSVLVPVGENSIEFINYFSQQQIVGRSFLTCSIGVVIEKMLFKIEDWLKMKFLFPSPDEQRKIAFCLSSLEALISAQAEKIELLKLHKKGLMQGLFPKMIDKA